MWALGLIPDTRIRDRGGSAEAPVKALQHLLAGNPFLTVNPGTGEGFRQKNDRDGRGTDPQESTSQDCPAHPWALARPRSRSEARTAISEMEGCALLARQVSNA
jgi:hypothetical protein